MLPASGASGPVPSEHDVTRSPANAAPVSARSGKCGRLKPSTRQLEVNRHAKSRDSDIRSGLPDRAC